MARGYNQASGPLEDSTVEFLSLVSAVLELPLTLEWRYLKDMAQFGDLDGSSRLQLTVDEHLLTKDVTISIVKSLPLFDSETWSLVHFCL